MFDEEIEETAEQLTFKVTTNETCPTCEGHGFYEAQSDLVDTHDCEDCNGTGFKL